MAEGWIKLYRKLMDSPIFENERLLKVFVYCLLKSSHQDRNAVIGLQTIELKKGQFVFGRKKAAAELNIPESTVWRHMKLLEKMNVLTLESNNKWTVVTVDNWGKYQGGDNESEQQMDGKRTADGQQMDTDKNVKNVNNAKNEKNKDIYSSVVAHLNVAAGTSFKESSKATQRLIDARVKEKFTEADFKQVIDNKVAEWKGNPNMEQYLRPNTLFGTKFESYLNQKPKYQRPVDRQSQRIVEHAKASADKYLETPIEDSDMFF